MVKRSVRIKNIFRLLFLLILPLKSTAYNNENGYVHPAGTPCKHCHESGEEVTLDNAHLLVATQQKLCTGCHEGITDVSHPYGFSPGSSIPEELPLDDKNMLTCNTCHNVHGKSENYLRTEKRGLDFCQLCHNPDFFIGMKDQGLSLVNSTHLDTKKYNNPTGPDNISVQCLGCHNENNYSSHDDYINGAMLHSGGMTGNHRIGVIYANFQSYGGYRAQNTLPESIILPDGKLSCISCHQGYSKEHGSLVMSNAGSSLCFKCHDL